MSPIDRAAFRVCMLGEEPSWIDEYERYSIDERLELYSQFRARVVEDEMKLRSDLRDFVALLESLEVRYLVIGGVAVNAHGYVRMTVDTDFWVALDADTARKVREACDRFGFPGFTEADFMRPGSIVQMGRPPHRIDILNRIAGVEFDACYERRVYGTLDGLRLPFISVEDLLANKRAMGRRKDLLDVDEFEQSEKYRK